MILHCQFYTGYLPLRKMHDLLTIRFLNALLADKDSLIGFLGRPVGAEEVQQLRNKYNIGTSLSHAGVKKRIWEVFADDLGL